MFAPGLLGQFPATIAGHPVVIEETGEFKALDREGEGRGPAPTVDGRG